MENQTFKIVTNGLVSTNTSHFKRGHASYRKPTTVSYHDDIYNYVQKHYPGVTLTGYLDLVLHMWPATMRRYDIDNPIKMWLDGIGRSTLIDDDCQVIHMDVTKHPKRNDGPLIIGHIKEVANPYDEPLHKLPRDN